jgi:membrane protein required for colicin V production
LTLFDLIALVLIALSCLAGYSRGGVRELVSAVAVTLSLVIAVYALPFTGPVIRKIVHPGWAGTIVAVGLVFLVAFITVRLAGHWLSQILAEREVLGAFNRLVGLGVGLIRGLLFLGVFVLIFNAVTPRELMPAWIAEAKIYPVADLSAKLIRVFLPRSLAFSTGLTRNITDKVTEDMTAPDIRNSSSYDPIPSDPAPLSLSVRTAYIRLATPHIPATALPVVVSTMD